MTSAGTAPATDPPLSAVARHVVAPSGIVSTAWPKVRNTCARLGWGFDAWQDGAGRLILAKRSDGQYAADHVVVSIPRQVGKTYLVACIIFALCLLEPGLLVIWTAHRKATAAETFRQFDGMAQRPRVAAHIRQVLRGRGEERIVFNNGSRILFGARESGFGRGMTDVDVLVFDEGQILPDSTLEDMGATQNVAKNPLTFVMGTPPRPKDQGEFFTLIRQEALDGESEGTLYVELSADRGADPLDREQWRKANPSFPRRTTERAMLRLRKKLRSDDSWAREALGIWDDLSHKVVMKKSVWSGLVDEGPPDGTRPRALAVDASHERVFSVAACWLEGESAHIEEVWAGVDEAAAVEWVAANAGRRVPVLVDVMSPAASVVPALKARHVNVKQSTAGDMAKACGLLVSRAAEGRLSHSDQEPLTTAVLGARKRPIGNAGGWGLDRVDPAVEIQPAVAGVLALLGAETAGARRSDDTRPRVAVMT